MMTMKNMQFLGVTFAGMLCAALAAAPAVLAQGAANSGRNASHIEGGVSDDTATKSETHFNGVDPAGDHSANGSRVGDAGHLGVAAHDGPGVEASRTGAAPARAPGLTRPGADDLGPIRLEGFTGLQRRANRNALIANAPKTPGRPPAAIGISAPLMLSGANGGTGRSAASVPAAGSAYGPLSSGRNGADLKRSAATGANTVASVATATGAGAAWHRPRLPSSTVTGALPHAAVISGTTVSHIASGPGYLGGPAKDRSGINGTAIRPKY
jgi:hypothetical protein